MIVSMFSLLVPPLLPLLVLVLLYIYIACIILLVQQVVNQFTA